MSSQKLMTWYKILCHESDGYVNKKIQIDSIHLWGDNIQMYRNVLSKNTPIFCQNKSV